MRTDSLSFKIGRKMESLRRSQHLPFSLHLNLWDSTRLIFKVTLAASGFWALMVAATGFSFGQKPGSFP